MKPADICDVKNVMLKARNLILLHKILVSCISVACFVLEVRQPSYLTGLNIFISQRIALDVQPSRFQLTFVTSALYGPNAETWEQNWISPLSTKRTISKAQKYYSVVYKNGYYDQIQGRQRRPGPIQVPCDCDQARWKLDLW